MDTDTSPKMQRNLIGEFVVDHLREIDDRGCVSTELMMPRRWQVPRQFGEIAITAQRKMLGQARVV